jgi:hypothetical protein
LFASFLSGSTQLKHRRVGSAWLGWFWFLGIAHVEHTVISKVAHVYTIIFIIIVLWGWRSHKLRSQVAGWRGIW